MSPPPEPSAAFPRHCTCLRLRKAARRVSQIYDRHLGPFGLTITQYGLLAQLATLDGIGIGALAERLIMDPTTLTRNLQPLARRGYVAFEPDPEDRRARRLRLLRDGRIAFERAKPAWANAQRHVEAALGGTDTAALHDTLDRMLARMPATPAPADAGSPAPARA